MALSQIFSLVPLWQPTQNRDVESPEEPFGALPAPDFPSFSVQELVQNGTLLLASSGTEFLKPTGILPSSTEVKKARKEAMGRLGLDFLDSVGGADEMDLEKELAADDVDIDMENCGKSDEEVSPISSMDVDSVKKERSPSLRPMSATPAVTPPPSTSSGPSAEVDLVGLSARERNRLKRKRKPGNSAFVAAPPPPTNSGSKYNVASAGSSNKYDESLFK